MSAAITKKKPVSTCSEWCVSCCTPADTYLLRLSETGTAWAPEDKGMMLPSMIHLDYMFFENDKFPVTCEKQGDVYWCHILVKCNLMTRSIEGYCINHPVMSL